MTLKTKLEKLIKLYPKNFYNNLSKELKKELFLQTNFLDSKNNVSISERIYCIVYNINSIPICNFCHKINTKFKSYHKGYSTYCSIICKNKSPKEIIKIKKTNLSKYGTTTFLQSKEQKIKTKQIMIKKYGVDHNFKSKKIQNKIKETKLKKYGFISSFSDFKTRDKIKKSNLIKYGVDNPTKNDFIKKKISKNILNKDIKPKQQHIKNFKNYNKYYIQNNFVINNQVIFDKLLNYFNITVSTGYILLKQFNIQYEKIKTNLTTTQEVIFNYLKELTNNNDKYIYKFKYNTYDIISDLNEKKLELDIYIEIYEKDTNKTNLIGKLVKKIAIEYDGLMFHSFGKSKHSMFNNYLNENKNKKKHLIKTQLCEENNIQLFHIFENEWINPTKQEIWKSMLKNVLLLNKEKIMARKCKIVDLSEYLKSLLITKQKELNSEISLFLNNNHLQGNSVSSIKLGLYSNNELVSIMTFGKSRYNKKYDYELLRFCSKRNTNVVGGGSKLLSYFKKHYMKDNETLVIIEVRFRKSNKYGGALESISRKKQSRIIATTQYYLSTHKVNSSIRFDAITMSSNTDINWIKNAFTA